MRGAVLYIGMSLDGYIADRNGGVGWMRGQDPADESPGSYPEFLRTVDTVVMGRTTYHQVVTELSPGEWIYAGLHSYVLTHRPQPGPAGITFTDEAPSALIDRLKTQPGRDIWICGGAELVNQLLRENRIDRFHIAVLPILLGSGIRLFSDGRPETPLTLTGTQGYNGITELIYRKREDS